MYAIRSYYDVVSVVGGLIYDIAALEDKVAEGHLLDRADESAYKGEYKTVMQGYNVITSYSIHYTKLYDGYINDFTPEFAISLYKEYRGKGIGTVLMRSMIQKLKKHGCSQASLSVQKDNLAYQLYKKLGFKVVAELHDDYLMALDLSEENRNNFV